MITDRWTLWWMHDGDLVPREQHFPTLDEAVSKAVRITERAPSTRPDWIKVFGHNREGDIRLRWNDCEGFHELSRTAAEILREEGYEVEYA